MQQLHLVGFTADNRGLIFSARKGSKSGGFVVTLDDKLLERVDEMMNRREAEEQDRKSRPKSSLSPREIQARLRAGRTISQVAREAGVEEDWVARWAAPIAAEQAQVVERAQELTFEKSRVGPSAVPLGDAVRWNMADKGIVFTDAGWTGSWDAFHLRGNSWMVRFTYVYRRATHQAEWEVDTRDAVVISRNRQATDLGFVAPGSRRPKMPRSMLASVDLPSVAPAAPPSTRTGTGGAASTPAPTAKKATPRKSAAKKKSSEKNVSTRTAEAKKKWAAIKKAADRKAAADRIAARKAAAKRAAAAKKEAEEKAARREAAKRAAAKKAAAKKAAAKKAAAKKAGGKKKAAPKKAAAKKNAPKKAPARRTSATKSAKAPAKKTTRTAAKRVATGRKPAPKKSTRQAPAKRRPATATAFAFPTPARAGRQSVEPPRISSRPNASPGRGTTRPAQSATPRPTRRAPAPSERPEPRRPLPTDADTVAPSAEAESRREREEFPPPAERTPIRIDSGVPRRSESSGPPIIRADRADQSREEPAAVGARSAETSPQRQGRFRFRRGRNRT